MDGILNLTTELDISLFDRVVYAFYAGSGSEQATAQQILTQFQDHPDAWQSVPSILQSSSDVQSKFLALNVLSNLIGTRWKVLPPEQTQGIRNFIITIILQLSQEEGSSKTLLSKLNITLVQILKQEWPHNWPDFIPELVSSSRASEALCENNMVILKLLFEEIFEGGDSMTQERSRSLQASLYSQFSQVFDLCLEVLQGSSRISLLAATLEAVARCLWWIGSDYVYKSALIDLLLTKYLNEPGLRTITLKCLTEMSRMPAGLQFQAKLGTIFTSTVAAMGSIIPLETNFPNLYPDMDDLEQQTIFQFVLFLALFLAKHHRVVEGSDSVDTLRLAHAYLLRFTQIREREIFKICLEYWHIIVTSLYIDMNIHQPTDDISAALNGLGFSESAEAGTSPKPAPPTRKMSYASMLSELREVIVDQMVKPAEVLVIQGEDGEVEKERLRESEVVALYKATREILVYLTHLDMNDMQRILTARLMNVMNGTVFSRSQLNSLCWAIGAIAGTMREDAERQFIIEVVKDLLLLCDSKSDKDDRAIVASNLMYVVGQYPRFLKSNWKFLKIFVDKLFEFMRDPHEGVQEMACDTFLKIAYKRRRDFVLVQRGESEPLIYTIMNTLPATTSSLPIAYAQIAYEAVGHMIFAQTSHDTRKRLTAVLMDQPNKQWQGLVEDMARGVDVLDSDESINQIMRIFRLNSAVCSAVGGAFLFPQFEVMFTDVLGLYGKASQRIHESIAKTGDIAAMTPKVRSWKKLRKSILSLIETCIRRAEEPGLINLAFIPALFATIFGPYGQDPPIAREADVLEVLNTTFNRLTFYLKVRLPEICTSVLEPTLLMIASDFTSYLEHRTGYYRLLRAINRCTYDALVALEPKQLTNIMDSAIWGMKHTTRDISDLALTFCLELFNNVAQHEASMAQRFFKAYFMKVLEDVLFVMTDSNHRCSFTFQSALLGRMFHILLTNRIRIPLAEQPDVAKGNKIFVPEHCLQLLSTAFPHTSRVRIEMFIVGLCEQHANLTKVKSICRDFLIQLKEFSGDNTELFTEQKIPDGHDDTELVGLVIGTRLDDDDEDL